MSYYFAPITESGLRGVFASGTRDGTTNIIDYTPLSKINSVYNNCETIHTQNCNDVVSY